MEDFNREVYDLVREIPRGRIATYGQIARLIGMPNHARHVGHALSSAPTQEALPCHRVVAAGGRLAAGWVEQRRLLEEEGVCFRLNGCADLRYLWDAAAALSQR